MIDLDLADLCARSYAEASVETPTGHALVEADGQGTVVAFRGTDLASMTDLLRDLDALPFADPALGPVHGGFYGNVASLAWRLIPKLSGPVVVTGHSKGGAEALLLAAILAHLGHPPARVVTFGAPCAGHAELARLVGTLPGDDYRNGDDQVPYLVPGYASPRPLTQLGMPRPKLDPLADHALTAYRAALIEFSASEGNAHAQQTAAR